MDAWEDAVADFEEDTACPCCGSTDRTFLGALGRLIWFRCRSCGIDFNHEGE